MTTLSKTEKSTLATYINKLEKQLQNVQSTITDHFCEESPNTRHRMLNILIDWPSIWFDRPRDLINLLYEPETGDD